MERRMTVAGEKPGRRYGRESQQEDKSEAQLRERFADLGWPCGRLGRDLGEDLHVQIYDDGRSTGLSFDVQLKSTADEIRLRRKKTPALGYRLDVKDLVHWADSTTLVVLVVWDVEKREGWWQPIPEIVKELDEAGKGWRKKKTATVKVPLANTTNGEGMRWLRRAVADHCLPVVPKPDMSFSILFDETEEGMAALRQFARALDMGEPVTFENGFIPKVEYPSWHRRIYGSAHPAQPVRMEIKPNPLKTAKAVRIEVESPEGPVSFPYVELLPTVQGRKRLVMTNEHQNLPLVFTLDLDEKHSRLKFNTRQTSTGNTVYEARDAAAFMLAVATPGSVIRVIDREKGKTFAALESSRAASNHDAGAERRWRDVLDKLCFIQQRAARYGFISREALGKVTTADVDVIDHIFQIFREGKTEVVKSISLDMAPADEQAPDSHSSVRFNFKGIHVSLLDLDIPLGDMIATVLDSERFVRAVRDARAQANASGSPVPVQLHDLHIVEEYLDWLPGNLPWAAMYEALDHLAGTTASRDGYFTRADARAAGASDAVFDALLAEHRIEPIAADVYHLVQFPHADREDLVVLWLQTDRQGVISHETALFLHELCDILPAHLHITVPPDWTPRDRHLVADVEIRYADVPEADLRWLGPVPYTAPLRTVLDCIAVGVSPELIEQAIAVGIQRGLFTRIDLPHSGRAESA